MVVKRLHIIVKVNNLYIAEVAVTKVAVGKFLQ